MSIDDYFDKWYSIEISGLVLDECLNWCETQFGIKGGTWLCNKVIKAFISSNRVSRVAILKFKKEEDALLCALKYGGEVYEQK